MMISENPSNPSNQINRARKNMHVRKPTCERQAWNVFTSVMCTVNVTNTCHVPHARTHRQSRQLEWAWSAPAQQQWFQWKTQLISSQLRPDPTTSPPLYFYSLFFTCNSSAHVRLAQVLVNVLHHCQLIIPHIQMISVKSFDPQLSSRSWGRSPAQPELAELPKVTCVCVSIESVFQISWFHDAPVCFGWCILESVLLFPQTRWLTLSGEILFYVKSLSCQKPMAQQRLFSIIPDITTRHRTLASRGF